MAAGHLVDLAPGWALWRDFAVRSTGFPVEGLQAFGGEGERLAEVARDPRFREAVAWQSRDALAHAIDKHARGVPEGPSRVRRREEVVASFWQRYCTKNDTIGFFGLLGVAGPIARMLGEAQSRRSRARGEASPGSAPPFSWPTAKALGTR